MENNINIDIDDLGPFGGYPYDSGNLGWLDNPRTFLCPDDTRHVGPVRSSKVMSRVEEGVLMIKPQIIWSQL